MTRRECGENPLIEDMGGQPVALNINNLTQRNRNFRTALWTGEHLQVTLMSIPVGSDIGVEMHADTDQFLRIEDGTGLVKFGKTKDDLFDHKRVNGNFAVFVPAGTWHNIVNIGNRPLKLYSVYAPPHHPFGTVQKTKYDPE
ncbi:MAG: cupin domain-containing protein [Clostridia bacterium]|nr:cupin domain-containing protein [Clostridia bacterium]